MHHVERINERNNVISTSAEIAGIALVIVQYPFRVKSSAN